MKSRQAGIIDENFNLIMYVSMHCNDFMHWNGTSLWLHAYFYQSFTSRNYYSMSVPNLHFLLVFRLKNQNYITIVVSWYSRQGVIFITPCSHLPGGTGSIHTKTGTVIQIVSRNWSFFCVHLALINFLHKLSKQRYLYILRL